MAKKLQLLRNSTPFDSKVLALQSLKAKLVGAETQLSAGEPLIASYKETEGEESKIGILFAISMGDNANYQVFEGSKLTEGGELELPQEVKDAIQDAVDSIKGGATDGYDTLGEIETLLKALQSELDTTQVGTGLGADGSYTAKDDAKYISGVSSLKEADEALDAALKAEETAREAADTELDGKIEQEILDRTAADTTLQEKIDALEDVVEDNKVVAADKSIVVGTDGTNTTVKVNIKTGDNALKLDEVNGLYVDDSVLEKYVGVNAISVSSVDPETNNKTISLVIDTTEQVLSQGEDGLKSNIQIVKLDTPSANTIKEEFKLVGNDGVTALGQTIKIYKDQSLQSANLTQNDSGEDVLRLVYNLADGTTSTVDINVDDFLRESEFKDGLQVINGEVSVKLASDNESAFLSVSEEGVKLSGVQNAITAAKNEIKGDVTTLDTLGKIEDKIEAVDAYTVNGKVINTNPVLSGADVAITGYVRSLEENEDLQLEVTDTVNSAFGKLEKAILDNEEVCSEAFEAIKTAVGLNVNLGYTPVAESNYISEATSVQDADTKLDANLKIVADKVTAIEGDTSYVKTVIVNGVTGNTSNNTATVTIDGGDISLTDYVKGVDSSAITVDDTINSAFGKVENQISVLDGEVLKGVVAGNGITVSDKTGNSQTITAKAVDTDPIIEVTANGIATKANASWDCGTY